MERATTLRRSSTRTTDFLDFLRRELAPTPERWSATLRLTLACVAAATIPVMVFRLHLPLIVMILALYLITKEDTTATLVGTVAGILGVSIGLGLALLVYLVALDVTWLRVCLVPAFVGGGLFLNRILVLPSLGTAIGLPAAMAMIVPDVLPPGVLDRFLFWLWWSVVLGLGVNLGVQLLLNPKDALDRLVEALSTRLRAVEGAIVRILAGPDGVALPPSGPPAATLALSGVAGQLQLLKIVEMRYRSLKPYHAELNALITFVDRLLTAAAALGAFNPGMLGEPLRRRLQRVAEACADMRRAIEQRRWPEHVWPAPATTLAGEENSLLPPLAEMERVLAMMPLALPGGASSSTTERPSTDAAEHRSLLVPDAFTNPEYGQFAIKGALAATVCYLIFTGAEYPGIYTSVITCMVCSLSTIGASTQKGVLRFAGSAIGGLMGVFTILYVFPHLDSLAGFWLPFGAGTAVAAYVNFGSPRLSYCGYQIGLTLQGGAAGLRPGDGAEGRQGPPDRHRPGTARVWVDRHPALAGARGSQSASELCQRAAVDGRAGKASQSRRGSGHGSQSRLRLAPQDLPGIRYCATTGRGDHVRARRRGARRYPPIARRGASRLSRAARAGAGSRRCRPPGRFRRRSGCRHSMQCDRRGEFRGPRGRHRGPAEATLARPGWSVG